ncbi:MAG TPA: phosphate ABC transporter substrate-binding protein PstS [Acidisarcina sp.]
MKKLSSGPALLCLAISSISITSCKSGSSLPGASPIIISGAGSSFVYPVMGKWTEAFRQSHPGVEINYQSIGSGGGIQQVKSGTVDFGATDAPLTDEQLAAMKPVIQIPETAGPVCITYNLPDLKQPLQLSGETLALIFLGQVKTWQDQAIKRDNPGVALPKINVVVTHRAEGSGTTAIFTTYLSVISSKWEQQVGKGTAVNWPVGVGGKGSEGVTGQIRQTPGAIGYVELTYAQQNNLPVAAIGNLAAKYVLPSTASTTAAIQAFSEQLLRDPRTPIVNPPASAADAYPITGLTFLLVPKDGSGKAKRGALKDFIKYIIFDGQTVAGTMAYAPLPDQVKKYDIWQISQLSADGQALP